jgi:Acyl-CoA thioesterase C-terminal domain/Acyl-CoA thioesterase N-terminal domain
MTLTFSAATSVTARGGGRYEVDLRSEYAIGRTKPNGGYLLACLGRAAVAAAGQAGSAHEHVVAAGAQYFASPDVGPACIETRVLRAGRTVTQVTAAIGNQGGPGVQAQFTLATLPAASEPYWGGAEPVTLPPIGECHPARHAGRGGITISFDPATRVTLTPDGPLVSGGGEFRAWFRDDDRDVVDSVGLLYVADALPPATAGVVLNRWVPTLDITVYVRAIPAPGPLRLRFRAQMIQDGFADEICEGWDSAGRLVLQSTQLAALRLPEAGPPGLAR